MELIKKISTRDYEVYLHNKAPNGYYYIDNFGIGYTTLIIKNGNVEYKDFVTEYDAKKYLMSKTKEKR